MYTGSVRVYQTEQLKVCRTLGRSITATVVAQLSTALLSDAHLLIHFFSFRYVRPMVEFSFLKRKQEVRSLFIKRSVPAGADWQQGEESEESQGSQLVQPSQLSTAHLPAALS